MNKGSQKHLFTLPLTRKGGEIDGAERSQEWSRKGRERKGMGLSAGLNGLAGRQQPAPGDPEGRPRSQPRGGEIR